MSTSPVSVLGALDSGAFIERYWQKEPLLIRNALDSTSGLVDGDTLAGLACEDLVESRLVTAIPATRDWTCEHGPFDESRFAALPATGWTLLVQAVDQWLPEIAALLERFDFLPRWRLDDVMASFATTGGGVGPHFDRYDVFLLQVQGSRLWQTGQRCDAHSPLRDHPDLKLLDEFRLREEWRLAPGDMLYLPPGVAHWGTALSDDCITCSVGFRAPSHAEIIESAVGQVLSRLGEDRRYADVPAAIDMDPFRINDAAGEALRSAWRASDAADLVSALPTVFGRLVTEPGNPDLITATTTDAQAIRRRFSQPAPLALTHHPASRFAYRSCGEQAVLFVDGEAYTTSTVLAKGICHGRVDTVDLADPSARELLLHLLERGSLDLAS